MSAQEYAVEYLGNLLTFFGVNLIIECDKKSSEQIILLNIPSTHLNGFFIGQHGDNLQALQHLTTMALKAHGYEDSIATVDVAGYKKQRDEKLARRVKKLTATVLDSAEPSELEPMSSYERRIVHQAVAEVDGVETVSVGEAQSRRVRIQKTPHQD